MRTTLNIDDELLASAKELTGLTETSVVIRRALADLVSRESQRRLMLLKGTLPDLQAPPRRRPEPE